MAEGCRRDGELCSVPGSLTVAGCLPIQSEAGKSAPCPTQQLGAAQAAWTCVFDEHAALGFDRAVEQHIERCTLALRCDRQPQGPMEPDLLEAGSSEELGFFFKRLGEICFSPASAQAFPGPASSLAVAARCGAVFLSDSQGVCWPASPMYGLCDALIAATRRAARLASRSLCLCLYPRLGCRGVWFQDQGRAA